jgi:hypothetical protein
MRRVGDRRQTLRLEVVGALWGTLESHKEARVRDLNQDGALLEYPVPVVAETVHAVTLEHRGVRLTLDVRVRHVRQAAAPNGATVYLAGVEFLSAPAALSDLVSERSAR